MSDPNRLLNFYASKHWAVLPETLQEMHGLYLRALERKETGAELDVEAVAAKLGRPLDNSHSVTVREDGIAIIPIEGPIFRYANLFTQISGATSIDKLATDFRQALDNPKVKSIILQINSPGGEADGTSEFAQHVFEARGQKPIVAYVSNLGASAAYWIASAADEIVANDAASLGSIGVVCSVCTYKNKDHLEFVSSQSPNKRPDPKTEGGRSQIQQWLDALADVFISTVARNRDMTAEEVIEQGGSGGLKVGAQAVEAGLADRLGTLESVISELTQGDYQPSRTRAENLNEPLVLENGANSETETQQLGVDNMAEENKTEIAKPDANADLDKTITEKIKAFFSGSLGASSTPPPAATNDAQAEADRAAVAKAQAEAESAKKEAAEAKEQVATLKKEARTQRFQSLAEGWAGETDKHVAVLEHLAQAEGGESSELFQGYVTQQKAISEQVNTSKLFGEIGSTAPVEGSAQAQIAASIKQLRDADPKLTEAQAFDKVWETASPATRAQYRDEERVSNN